METLRGEIDRVTFHSEETGFCVLKVRVRGRRDHVTVVGRATSITAGESISAQGDWVMDRQHGRQFKAASLQTSHPTSPEGIIRYLGGGAIRGIGPKLAERIVNVYGERTLEIIDQHPDLLLHVPGVGKMRLRRIRESWEQGRVVREIMLFLFAHGVSSGRAVRIYQRYGQEAIRKIKENPYRLADEIRGIGFKSADKLAMELGIDRDSPQRARAAVVHLLHECAGQGHCRFPQSDLIERAESLLDIPDEIIRRAVDDLAREERIIRETMEQVDWLWLPRLHEAEWGVARELRRLTNGTLHPLGEIDTDRALEWVQDRLDIALAAAQIEAVRQASTKQVLVVTGGPGVGKTTIVRSILEIFLAKRQRCVLAAPTGRAAKRLEETTGQSAKTIHRLLEFRPGEGTFRRGPTEPLEGDLFVLDETSMLDVTLAWQFLRAVPAGACVVLVGDVDQLPSVGPGNVLADVIRSKSVPVVRLTTIFRQSAESRIVTAAHAINAGQCPSFDRDPENLSDFYFLRTESPEDILDRLVHLVAERIPRRFSFDPLRDIQVLVPMNRSVLGARNLNLVLQKELNPSSVESGVERYGWRFAQGDRVIQLENNYDREVFNGDLGIVSRINRIDQTLEVELEDGRRVDYDFTELDELALAYALTVHKSQGSEYPCVVIPLHTQHYMLLERNLLYTAVTRGKQLVIIVGSDRALRIAVGRKQSRERFSALQDRLILTGTQRIGI